MDIISRSQWGARAWNGQPYSTPLSSRTHFLVHYHGGPPPNATGKWVPKNVEAIHLGNGWSGVGYNFLVDQDGRIYEGRGWDLVGAHCPGRNRDGIGVYVAIGGNQEPTDAAKASVVWLYSEANRRTGRTLTTGVHGDWYNTQCAGHNLTPWVHAGMPLERGGGAQDVDFDLPDIAPEPTYWTPTAKGYTTADVQRIVDVAVDNLYGPATMAAVRKLQKRLGVTADGYFGPTTAAAFESSKRKPSEGKRAPRFPLPRGHWYGVESDDPRNHSGYWRKDRAGIKRWQRQMKRRGWSIGVDGRFGAESKSVARSFQKEKGLAVDGLVGARTWRESWTAPIT